MYAGCKLPIASVKHYKRALSLGETLSAANLGFEYLDSGMADEAKALIEQAMEAENHVSRVEKCLAEIVQHTQEEAEKEGVLIANAETYRKFFVKMGKGLSTILPAIDGLWKFSFGEVPLTVSLVRLKGVVEVVNTESPGYNALVFGIAAPPTVKTERYTIDAVLTGSVAEFELRQEDVGDGAGFIGVKSILGGLGTSKKSGFIVL